MQCSLKFDLPIMYMFRYVHRSGCSLYCILVLMQLGATPLGIAIGVMHNYAFAELLMASGADVNAKRGIRDSPGEPMQN